MEYGETIQQAENRGVCIRCKQPASPRCYSEAGRREYHLSGLCELCFDEMIQEPEDGE